MSSKTFEECNFYNVTPTVTEGFVMTYKDCNFNKAYNEAQAGGYIAYTGEPVIKTVNGVDYVFGAKLVEKAGLVDWGFGMKEYWVIGATAKRDITIVDEIFAYDFAEIPVTADEHKATATLVAIKPGKMQMSLTLQSQIGINLLLNSNVFADATVQVNDEAIAIKTNKEGIPEVSFAVSPTDAIHAVTFVITIGDNSHEISVSVGAYAKALLASEPSQTVKNLTYSMIEYVRAMNPGADFLDGVKLEEYEAKAIPGSGVASGASGCQIAFCLDDTIAIAVSGAGESIVLKLPSGRVLDDPKTLGDAKIFDELAVNELAAGFTVVIGEASHTYSLVDYYYAIGSAESLDENQKKFYVSVITALYSYSQYAFEYAKGIN